MREEVNLTNWLRDIENLLREKEYITPSFRYVSEYFLNIINEVLSGRRFYFSKYDRQLYLDLCKFLETENKAIKICMPSAVKYVKNFNYKFKIQKGKSNNNIIQSLRQLKRNLTRIRNVFESKCFVLQIRNSVIKQPTNGIHQKYLIDLVRVNIGISSVSQFIKNNIAKSFFAIYEDGVKDSMLNDNYTKNNTSTICNLLKDKLLQSLKSLQDEIKLQDCLKDIYYENVPWKHNQNFLVQDSKEPLKIFNTFDFKETQDLGKIRFTKRVLNEIRNLIIKFVEWIISHFIFWSLSELHKNLYASTIHKFTEHEYFNKASTIIKNAIEDNRNSHDVTFLAGESFLDEYSSFLSKKIVHQMDIKLLEKEITSFVLDISNSAQKHSLENRNVEGFAFQDTFLYKHTISEYLDDLAFRIMNWLTESQDRLSLEIQIIGKNGFLSKLMDKIIMKLSNGDDITTAPMFITHKVWRKIVTSLIKDVQTARKKPWKVVFPIGNLDCKGRIIEIGKTRFYDPRVWDFGEDDYIDSSKNLKISFNEVFMSNFQSFPLNRRSEGITRNSARAAIYVNAVDKSNALEIARNNLIHSINLLVFNFSDETYGFKPQLPLYYHITDLERKAISSGFQREELFGIFEIENSHEEDIKKIHRFLSQMKSTDEQLLRSLEWYHKGLWDFTEHKKFVSFWIALEKLVVDYSGRTSRTKEKLLLHYLPKVTVSWRSTSINYGVTNHIGSIIYSIKEDTPLRNKLNRNNNMKEWDKGYAILENLDFLERIAKNKNIEQQISLLREFLTPDSMRSVKKQVSVKRKIEKFRVAYLYSMRNSVFHEGRISEKTLTECNVILKKILDNLLQILTSQNFDTMNKIVKYVNRPYSM